MSTILRRFLVFVAVLAAVLTAFEFLAPHRAARVLIGLARSYAGLEAKRVHAADLDFAYLEGGSGEPLILIHGFGADKDSFTRVAAELTPRYRVLVPDLPGFGESSRPDAASYTIAEQAERVRAFARALGVGRVHLGGSSMGGFIATRYALDHPDEVASLWLLAPAGTRVAFESELTAEIEQRGANPLLVRTPEDFARTMEFVMARKPFMPPSVRRVLAERAAADYPLHARIFEQVGPGKVATIDGQLRGLATPALVVWGAQDRALSPKAAEVYRAAMPNARIVIMDGIGHLPMVEAPADAALDYLRFRDDLARP